MKLKFLSGDIDWKTYGGKFISPEQDNGDWPYWLVVEFINWKETTGRRMNGCRYAVTISAVSPQAAGIDNLHKAAECCGIDEIPADDATKVQLLSDYGTQTQLDIKYGNNATEMMKWAREHCDWITGILFGFMMDRPVNKIGSTGWDAIRGDLLAGLRRNEEDES